MANCRAANPDASGRDPFAGCPPFAEALPGCCEGRRWPPAGFGLENLGFTRARSNLEGLQRPPKSAGIEITRQNLNRNEG